MENIEEINKKLKDLISRKQELGEVYRLKGAVLENHTKEQIGERVSDLIQCVTDCYELSGEIPKRFLATDATFGIIKGDRKTELGFMDEANSMYAFDGKKFECKGMDAFLLHHYRKNMISAFEEFEERFLPYAEKLISYYERTLDEVTVNEDLKEKIFKDGKEADVHE
ncbi:MAG: hypothetical protein MJZ34_02545 [Paludibacteraceae bacterium]|nr:hypothetical protein [Paludibacteraceae bacterium]